MKALNEKTLALIREEELAKRLIKNVDDPDISDESFNNDLIKLCKFNQLTDKITTLNKKR